jgi:hypothetical protein
MKTLAILSAVFINYSLIASQLRLYVTFFKEAGCWSQFICNIPVFDINVISLLLINTLIVLVLIPNKKK